MRRSLTFKLVASFLGISLIAILLVALSSAAVAALQFNRLVSQEATNTFVSFVSVYYQTHGNLNGIDEALRQNLQPGEPGSSEPPRLFPTALTDPSGLVVIGGEGYRTGTQVASDVLVSGTPIRVNGAVIAVSLPRQLPPPRTRAQEEFVQTAGLALGAAAGGAAIVSVMLGLLLARTITRPVGELTAAARRMAKGELAQTVDVHTRDEVGELADAFNQMSQDLAQADRTRRQMTADIAHELRNPLTVMGGYLEAMRSGDLQPTQARLQSVFEEIQNLELLVEDLRTLSLADAGALSLDRQPLAPRELLNRVASRYAQQAAKKQVTLSVEAAADLPVIQADEARMMQVLSNLVSNALRHTPSNGKVRLSAYGSGKNVRFLVADTGEGISPEDLPRVFDRFYRADRSRQAGDGELGLGLAIAKAFVQAHGGRISVESTLGQGSTFLVEMTAADGAG